MLTSTPSSPLESDVATVSLVKSTTIPSQKGRAIRACVGSPTTGGCSSLLFEPEHDVLAPLGVSASECVITVSEDGEVLLPVNNYQGITARRMQLGTVRSIDGVALGGESLSERTGTSSNAPLKAVECILGRIEQVCAELNLPLDTLSPGEATQLKSLVTEFSDVFALNDSELGCTDVLQHHIDTSDHPPIKQQPYRTPVARRQKVSEMIDAMEKQGVIQPTVCPWASPVVLVPKKDGSLRFCVDYRRLNSVTRKDVYPLPQIDDILDALGEAKYFSTLDLIAGHWQVELDEDSRTKSAFTTFKGLYEFTRMPFGLCNAPATFQRIMQRILAGLEWKSCFVYLDDVLVASRTFDEHLQHLRDVFLRLREAHLRLKPKKCGLLRQKVPFLGHVISGDGIQPDPAKTEKVSSYPHPVDAIGVRRFVGLASYYRRFVLVLQRLLLHCMP